MVKTEQQKIRGLPLILHECVTEEEARQHGLPAGQCHFWTYDGRRMDAIDVVELMQSEVAENPVLPELVDPAAMQRHFAQVVNAQTQMIVDTLNQARDEAIRELPPEAAAHMVKQLDEQIALYSTARMSAHHPGIVFNEQKMGAHPNKEIGAMLRGTDGDAMIQI